MNAREAYARLKRLGIPVVETAEAAAVLGQSKSAASQTLARLASAGLVHRVRSGSWWIDGTVQPTRLAQYLTAPFDSYLSLATALRLRGMIEQIPVVTYVVSLGRARRIATSVGPFSIHHIDPELFGGFGPLHGVQVATPEKALFDIAYLAGGRGRLRASLPELELPRGFRERVLRDWVARIPSQRARTLVETRLEKTLRGARSA